MKKIKLALVALTTVLGIGGAIAGTSSSPGQYFTSQTGTTQIPGQKGIDWDCHEEVPLTCAYLETQSGERVRVEGQRYDK